MSYWCSCGRVVHRKAAHRAAHERRDERHEYITRTRFLKMFPLYCTNCGGRAAADSPGWSKSGNLGIKLDWCPDCGPAEKDGEGK